MPANSSPWSGIEARRAETLIERLGAKHESPARVSARRPALLSWQDGMRAFDGETLSEAIAEVSRQTGWQFELADPELGGLRVGGYVVAEPEAFIELLSSSLDLHAERVGPRHALIARPPPVDARARPAWTNDDAVRITPRLREDSALGISSVSA